ncbi:MAG TPA: isochorismatase family protein, partial [Thermoleophilia bacterium]|nr:isochorismatase family protein [Thermoleophilia bacterium]
MDQQTRHAGGCSLITNAECLIGVDRLRFHGTCLELLLRARGIDTVLLVGGSTHVGIAATAFAGRDLD